MSINEEVFDVLHRNLVAVKPQYGSSSVILCPICLREISRDDVIKRGYEHVVPQTIVKSDPPELAGSITKNQRCGVTVLCRKPRNYGSDKKLANQGCNGLKGSLYDWPLGKLLSAKELDFSRLTHRHYGAFQNFGYGYILRPELNEIRVQFDFPDVTVTRWVSHVRLLGNFHGVFTTANGNPFIVGGLMHDAAALEVMFRKFWVVLPGGRWEPSNFHEEVETLMQRF